MDLVFDRVGKRFDQRDALIDLSFNMASGEMAFSPGTRCWQEYVAEAFAPT